MFGQPIVYKNKPRLRGVTEVDAFTMGLRELFFVDHPELNKGMPTAEKEYKTFLKQNKIKSVWIHYPNTKNLIQCLPENEYFRVRTARNRDLITNSEQINYRNIVVGLSGLSVGSSVLSALVISGGPKNMKIADFDHIEISNLNRIRARLSDAGRNKTIVAAEQIWALDPFAKLNLYDKGVTKHTIKEFVLGKNKLGVFVDAIDSIDLKVKARLICREFRIPVLMATDNGDAVILDVERFDLEPKREIFHGLIGKIQVESLNRMDYKTWLRLATQIVEAKYLTESMQESLLKIGKSIASVPQLGTSAAIGGSACAFAIRRIANKQSLDSGRYIINLEEKLIPRFNDKVNINHRKKQTKEFIKSFSQR